MRKAKAQINNERLQVSSDVLRALAHPLRMKILEFIDKNKTINVNKIYNTLKLEQSITSQHLKILRASGLVHTHREGKFIHCFHSVGKTGVVNRVMDEFSLTMRVNQT